MNQQQQQQLHPAVIDARFFLYGRETGRGVLGVDWSETVLGDLEPFAELLAKLPADAQVRKLEFSHCLGRSQETTPVNVYRRLRRRVRQIENTMAQEGRLEEIKVRFYVTQRQGTPATVETVWVTPLEARGFSNRMRHFMVRNRLLHLAQAWAEPPLHNASALVIGTIKAKEESSEEADARATARHALWGRSVINLVKRRDKEITASAIFTLLQKNSDYLFLSSS